MRRPEALHAAALLVDQHRRRRRGRRRRGSRRQRAQLLAALDVALEQDQAPGIGVANERALVVGEARPEAAADEGAHQFLAT